MAGKRKSVEESYSDADYKSATAVADPAESFVAPSQVDAPDYTNGSPTPVPAPVPTPDGTQPVPQPARTPKRKPRDPDSVRPVYMLAGQERGTNAIRVLMVRPTIGQARKAMADVQQMGGRDYDGYVIFRCKAVA